jgi:hypothetical protein
MNRINYIAKQFIDNPVCQPNQSGIYQFSRGAGFTSLQKDFIRSGIKIITGCRGSIDKTENYREVTEYSCI